MKTSILHAVVFTAAGSLLPFSLFSQNYQLTVQNGYGSTTAAPGDTIHIWAEEWGITRTFSHWSGDTNFLERPEEWHTQVIMPAQNVTITSNTALLPTGINNPLSEEQIMGRDRMKRVFSYFPANNPAQGVCWLWHGTGGSASSWAGAEFEQNQFVKYLVSKDWGVIITESDESTTNTDLNGDGNLRYDFYPDSMSSVDIANVRAIRDTFIHRGKMNWTTPQASLGFSAGGAFSTVLAEVLQWQAGVTHGAPGVEVIIEQTQTPLLFSMNSRDNHPDVGLQGNLDAFANFQTLMDHGICTEFYFLRPSPTYPERYKRFPGITTTLSYSIHNELVANECFDNGGYLTKAPAEIQADVIANQSSWPTILSLTVPQRQFVLDQLEVMWPSHHFHTSFMAADFTFISDPCSAASGFEEFAQTALIQISPNPVNDWLYLPEHTTAINLFDPNGSKVLFVDTKGASQINVSNLPKGLYFLQLELPGATRMAKIVKQ
ncbi:MAG: T9SS type A sorting domain-containing protein [Saprospiraceae bacterium]|nr:T9SS type A sorting domain-containing protein [Saprospiraceae bacterium]